MSKILCTKCNSEMKDIHILVQLGPYTFSWPFWGYGCTKCDYTLKAKAE